MRPKARATEGGCTWEFDDTIASKSCFKKVFILFALSMLLCPTTKPICSVRHLWAVVNMDSTWTYNWAKLVLR